MTPACPKPTKNKSYAEPVQLSRPEYPSQRPTHHADTQISPITLKSSASKTPREKSGIKDYARRVSNRAVGLPEKRNGYTREVKVAALSKRIWNDQASAGALVKELLHYILYGGTEQQLPERLWQGVADPKWKLAGLGISALGEIVGWALPDRFPPRNGRTSKALRSLGFDVTVHVG